MSCGVLNPNGRIKQKIEKIAAAKEETSLFETILGIGY